MATASTPRAWNGAERIADERKRQKAPTYAAGEGYTADHDSRHKGGELIMAAACYMKAASGMPRENAAEPDRAAITGWPFEPESFKPAGCTVRNLVIAGALLAAEIDRILVGVAKTN